MTDYRGMYDREYIGHWDLEGRDVTVTIEKVISGNLVAQGNRKSKKPILHFVGKEKAFVCNKTNGRTIATLYGPQIESWVGKKITLFASMTRDPNGGEAQVECIRVRPSKPAESSVSAKPVVANNTGSGG